MANSQQLFAEFESLGEIEVNHRLEHKVYDDPTRAYALRWLNEKAIERAGISDAVSAGKHATVRDLARRAQGAAQLAILLAVVATVAAALAGGVAYRAMRDAHAAAQRAELLATSITPPTPAPAALRASPHRHRPEL